MRTRLSTLTVLILVAGSPLTAQRLPVTPPDAVGISSERLTRIDAVFEHHVQDGRIAGALGMIIRHGKIA